MSSADDSHTHLRTLPSSTAPRRGDASFALGPVHEAATAADRLADSFVARSGLNLGNMAKMLKCAGNDDVITIKAEDQPDTVTFMMESPSAPRRPTFSLATQGAWDWTGS